MDKRKFTRTDFETGGVIGVGGDSIPFTLVDVSLKGILTNPERPDDIAIGDAVTVDLTLPGSTVSIHADARCVHRELEYLGFRFEMIDAESMAHLRRLLELNTGRAEKIGDELSFLSDT
jgi:hypothetical protein